MIKGWIVLGTYQGTITRVFGPWDDEVSAASYAQYLENSTDWWIQGINLFVQEVEVPTDDRG